MHLLKAQPGVVADGSQAVDLGQAPDDIVVLSAADTELASLAAAGGTLGEAFPCVRLANLMQLSHNASVDLYCEEIIAKARSGRAGIIAAGRRRSLRDTGRIPTAWPVRFADHAIGIVVVDTSFVFHYFRVMKNVTVTLPEDVARWLRVRAAESERSVSKWLADLLQSMKRREDEYEVAMERFLARRPWKMEWVDGRKPTRDELHDRAGLR